MDNIMILKKYYAHQLQNNKKLERESIEIKMKLLQGKKIYRDLLRENERMQAVIMQVEDLIDEKEDSDNLQDEQITQVEIKLDQLDQIHESEVQKFEHTMCEKSEMLMQLENLPVAMAENFEYLTTGLLLLREELEIEERTLQREENNKSINTSFFNFSADERQALKLLIDEIDILTN